jgi:signal transduction histidine kinase
MSERARSAEGVASQDVLDVARDVFGELDVERVLERVLKSARELIGARYAAIGVLDESRTVLARFITTGVDESTRREMGPPPTGRGVLGELIRNPAPLRVASVGRHPRSYGFPSGHPPMESFLGVPVLVGSEPFGNLYLTDKQDGAEFTADDERALVRLAEFAGVAIDHARRYTGSEARCDELEQTVDALGAMVEISRAIGGETDLAVILELMAKRGRALISARALVIELQIDEGLEVVAAAGYLPANLVGHQMALEGSVAEAALRTGVTQRLADELTKARFNEHGLGQVGFDAEDGLIVPLMFRGQSLGVLVAIDRLAAGPQFSVQDERLLEAFATSAATAVWTAQSVATEQHRQRLAAAEQERARWARELHDETLQSLAALRIGLAAADRAGGPDALAVAVRTAIGQLESDISSLRGLITELRPPVLDELGAKAAIEALAERVTSDGLIVDAVVELAHESGRAAQRHTPELEITMYRIVQEALTNAVKNGHATRSVVEVIEGASTIEVRIRDDGAGFDPATRTDGFGVLGMRERAALLHGTLDIESAPGQGTTVRCTLPVKRRVEPGPPAAPAAAPANWLTRTPRRDALSALSGATPSLATPIARRDASSRREASGHA